MKPIYGLFALAPENQDEILHPTSKRIPFTDLDWFDTEQEALTFANACELNEGDILVILSARDDDVQHHHGEYLHYFHAVRMENGVNVTYTDPEALFH